MRLFRYCAAALIAAASAPLGAQVLTLEEARARALESQPALRALEHSYRATQNAALADGALPDPRLKLGALNFPTRNFPSAREDMTQVGLSWEQTLPGGDKRRLRSERTHAEAGQFLAESHTLMQVILRDVGVAWVEAWNAAAAERQVAELSREHERSVELARIALGAGRGSQSDVLAARQALGQATDRRLELAAQAERARAALARWLPDAANRPLPDGLPVFNAPPPLETLRATLAQHPQHAMHAQAQVVADADVALAREARKSDSSFEVGYYARSGDRSDMVMFQVAFELPLFAARKQDAQLVAKLKLAERTREQRADHLQQLQAELASAHAEWRIAEERLKNLESSILPDARSRLDTLTAQHGAGAAPLATVFEARRGLIDARMQLLAVTAARARARIALQYFEEYGGHQR